MSSILVKYEEDFGRMGDLSALFVCTEAQLARLKEKGSIQLGEALGKHSNIFAELSDKTLTVKSTDGTFISTLQEIMHGAEARFAHHISGCDILGKFLDDEKFNQE